MKPVSSSRTDRHPTGWLLGLALLVGLLLAAACAAPPANPAAEFTQALPSPISTDQPELAIDSSPISGTGTPTSPGVLPPPAGIVFLTDEGHFITQSSGPPKLLYQPEETGVWSNLSSDGRFVLEFNTYDQVLVDLQEASQTHIWPREGMNLCPFQWVDKQTGYLISVLLPPGADPGFSCNLGSPVLLSAYTQELTVLDERGSGLSAPAVSPGGKGFAYDLDGVPWLYWFDTGPSMLDLSRFGMDSLQGAQLADPAWSPSGRFMAWTFRTGDDPDLQGVVLFDLEQQTAQTLIPYDVSAYENFRPRLYFSPSEAYLVLDHYLVSQGDFASQVLAVDGQLSRQLEGYFSRWSPKVDWLMLEKKPGGDACRLGIESPDGSTSIPICRGDQAIWSPDGSQIITYPYNRELFWLTDLGTQHSEQIDLPVGAQIIRWEAIDS